MCRYCSGCRVTTGSNGCGLTRWPGITVWGVVIPGAIAYAGLAGMPPQAGLYTILAAFVAYAIFGTSRQVAVVATSASAVMLASTVAEMNPADPAAYLAFAAALVLLIGAVFFVAGIFKLGFIANFISQPVMQGFVFGLALFIMVKQLPKLLGIPGGEGNSFEQLISLLGNLDKTRVLVAVIGFCSLAALFGLRRLSERIPGGLVVLFAGILASAVFGLSALGVSVVGNIPSGFPDIGLPHVKLRELWILLPGAMGISLVLLAEGLAAASTFASQHDYEINPDQELIAYGFANLGSGLLGGLAAGGGLSQSSVNDKAGAKSAMSLIVAAALCLVTILFLTPLFAPLPEVILAALIIFAVTSLMKVKLMLWYYRVEPAEFWLGITALLGVLVFGVLPGLAAAVLLTLIVGVYRSSRPYGSVLGQVPGEPGAYSDIQRHPENVSIPGLVIFRFNSPVYFANASLFHRRIRELVASSAEPVRAFIIDMVTNDRIDITSVEMLEKLTGELKKSGIALMVTQVHEPVRETIRRSGMGPHFAHVSVFPGIDAAVKSYLKN